MYSLYILYYVFCQIKQILSFKARYPKKRDILTNTRESGMVLEKRDFPPERGNVDTYDVTSHTCGPGCQFDNGNSLWAAVLRPSVLSIDGEDILRVRL